jgi:ABC-2 type transport system ATP-binding protein
LEGREGGLALKEATSMTDAIRTQSLTKYYGPRCVVRSLDLRVPVGSVYGFLGRNGAGKSTMIRMLLGMARPSFGKAELLGHDAATLPPEVRGRIAYLAEGHPLYRWMTIAAAVRFSRAFYGPRWNQPALEQILDHFDLPRRARIGRLSNGQRAQVALALAVAPDPDLLILDDPTLGLDTVVRRDFLLSMIHLIQRQGRTIFFSSHILTDVERVADRIGILVDGVLRVDCPTEHFKESVRKVVLEFPGRPPAFPDCEGLVSRWEVGRRLELVIVNFGAEHRQIVESLEPLSWDLVELNLEDAFVEYTRGPRRPLPAFTEEATALASSARDSGGTTS